MPCLLSEVSGGKDSPTMDMGALQRSPTDMFLDDMGASQRAAFSIRPSRAKKKR